MGNLKQRLIKPGTDFNYAEGVKVKNASTSVAIAADTVVFVNGYEGPFLKVTPALAAAETTCNGRLMIAKHEIPADGFGVVLPWKLVTGVATNNITVGKRVFLADTGGIRNHATATGTVARSIGHCLVADATAGVYLFCGEGAVRDTDT
jgi:hypothetical protein